ncbi:unnamed protein product [Xylocopa violacea]|uniref:Myeloid differentiation primary response protein MyD88 n=1 Tax=Xylocopa violacea TaxID=135666 RepID=A0ABP1P2W0_XYLVO
MIVDLSTVPLVALSAESKHIISVLLNPPKVIPSENGLPRDWRGLAHLCNLSGELMPLVTSHPDPATYILTAWQQKEQSITFKDLQIVLEEIERWDILDDTLELFERDAARYLEQEQKAQTSAEIIVNDVDEKVLTVDDLHRLRQGLESQYYDAFLLYADEDINFVTEMVDKLENQYNLKLCLKDRDLIGGVTFEHEAVMTLISERCNRLIVVVSSNFLKSSANKFFLNYAQALSIDKKQRKIIPCLYEKCQLPPQLSYMFVLDYNRVGLYDFWGKLRDSVQAPNKIKETANISHIKEIYYSNLDISDKDKKDKPNSKYVEPMELKEFNIKDEVEKLNKEKNLDHSECTSVHNAKNNNKKYTQFLQWKRWKHTKKGQNDKKEYVPITETVSLPSLEGLDTLSTSTESVTKKHKTRFINKYVKKVLIKS